MKATHRFFPFTWLYLITLATGMAQNPPVAGPSVWLRADQGVIIDGNGKVERWEDQSGNANHFEQATESKRPELLPDGFVLGGAELNRLESDLNGGSFYSGMVGIDFQVDEEVEVTELAAFDQNADGISGSITVVIWERLDAGTPGIFNDDAAGTLLETLTFTAAEPGTLEGRWRWKALPTPRVLQPGNYTLAAWGYNSPDGYEISLNQTAPTSWKGMRRVGLGRYGSTPAEFGNSVRSGDDYYAGAANLKFSPTADSIVNVPALRFDGTDDGLQAISALAVGRPSTVFVVFERDHSGGGYIMQNSGGPHWFVRHDGVYAQGWVRNTTLDWRERFMAAIVNNASSTRAFLNGEDWTHDATPNTASPGRLAVGGGAGLGNDPMPGRIAEVLVYDQELTEAQRWQTEQYLAERYGIDQPGLLPPVVSPTGSFGSGDVTVSLSAPVAGSDLRYTTDGTEPDASSPLYAAPFMVSRGTEVRARAFLAGTGESGVSSQYYGEASELPLAGATMWLRSDRGLESDEQGRVRRWRDATGNGNDMEQGTGSQRPRVVEDGIKFGQGLAVKGAVNSASGSNTHSGSLGMDFVVTEPIEVTELAAFDHLEDSFPASVTVAIWQRDDRGTPHTPGDDLPGTSLAEVEFTPGDPGVLGEGSLRFKNLPSPVTLPPGNYTLLGWGFFGNNRYHNNTNGSWNPGQGVEFVNQSRYSTSLGSWPTILDFHPVKYNGSSNFRFHRVSGTRAARPTVSFDGSDDGLWAAPTSSLSNPATVYVVYDRPGTDTGYVLQSTVSSNWWFIRNDGFYNQGWVSNRSIERGAPSLAGMTSDASGTRAYSNGDDWTIIEGRVGQPNRLALGGGNGYIYDPLWVEVAELVAYDRTLNEAERWQVENYLSQRYLGRQQNLPPAAISPPGDSGVSSVDVTITSVPGSEIRYTTDGSEPTASSALYSSALTGLARPIKVRARPYLNGIGGPISEESYGLDGSLALPVVDASMWLRADCGLTRDERGAVSHWRDLTGNGNDVVQGIASLRPTWEPEGFVSASGDPAILVRNGLTGSTTWNGSLGDDFFVSQSITITHLGAFDHLGDGFEGDITVAVWDRDDNGTPLTPEDDSGLSELAAVTFTNADPGVLEGGNLRFKELPVPLVLAPGSYTVFGSSYVGGNLYRESRDARANPDGRYEFVGARFSGSGTPGAFPGTLDGSGPLDYNGAANFRVAGPPNPPVPAVVFDGLDDSLSGVESMNFGRPSTVFMVAERDRNESGYFIQNRSGSHWFIRNDGYYAGGWVRNESFGVGVPYLVAMLNGPDYTRALRNGSDVTINPDLFAAVPGRINLGGGAGGIGNDPLPVRIAEVIVYDRVLSEGEIWQVQRYLADRNKVYVPSVEQPVVMPDSGYGSGDLAVTIASNTPGAALYYTTDGSEPEESDLLYSGSFNVPRGTTVRARAYLAGAAPSGITETFYGDAASHPLPVTDPAMWLRADRGVEMNSAGEVLRWNDLSGNGNDVSQILASKAPQHSLGDFGGAERTAAPLEAGFSAPSNWSGALGTDFIVEEPVEITELGIFDEFGDGLAGTIEVKLMELSDGGTPGTPGDDVAGSVLASRLFTPASPGTVQGSSRFKALGGSLLLNPGRYHIYAQAYDPDDYLSQENFSVPLGHGITFPSVSRYASTEGALIPGTIVGDNRYLAVANFKFRKPGLSIPKQDAIRFDGVNDGLLGEAGFSLGRPSTVFMVFNQLRRSQGRLIQSGSGANWLLGTHGSPQGYYAEGWVSQTPVRPFEPSLAIAEQGVDYSRYHFNGEDFTQNPIYLGNLGRVALGGAEGTYNQPTAADLAELVIYDRNLSPEERTQVAAALSARYGLAAQTLPGPRITPDGGLFPGGQTVTLDSGVPGVEIRFTTNGDEPTETSTLYQGPIPVTSSTLIRARAFATGYLSSLVEEASFTIDPVAPSVPDRASLALWLRAATGVETDLDGVTVWRDLSGSGADAQSASGPERPQLAPTAIGGAPGIVFDGSNDYLSLAPGFSDFDEGFTAVFVVRPDETIGSWERLIDFGRGVSRDNIFFARESTTTNFSYGVREASSADGVSAPDSFRSATDQILTVVQDASGAVRIFRNGNLEVEDLSVRLPRDILRTINYVGRSNWSQDARFSGAIGEIMLYNKALSDFDRESLEEAIRTPYGISSSATGIVGFSPDSAQLYPSGVDVTMQSVTPGAEIYYTIDGSVPDVTSTLYSSPVTVSSSTRIRARAFATGLNPSRLSEVTYLVGDPPGAGDGLFGTYYDNIDFTGSSLMRVDPEVNFNWGSGSPDPAIAPDSFSVRWTGKILARFSEDTVFSTYNDDGVRLWIDLDQSGTFEDPTELLIDDWVAHGPQTKLAAPVALQQGQLYDVRLEFFENFGGANVSLSWENLSLPREIIPQSQLFSNAAFSQTVSTPVISPPGGTYNAAVEVSIATSTSGATIYYTRDGSEPDQGSTPYANPFMVGADETVRARGFKAGYNPSGAASVFYDIDAQPPIITEFAWDGVAISEGETFVKAGAFSVMATDNQGIASAEFYYLPPGSTSRILIGRDTFPGNGLSSNWNVGSVSDGSYQVIARVFDTAGTFSEVSIGVNVALAVLPAPTITQPVSGASTENPTVSLQIVTQPSANVRIFRGGVFIFAGYANTAGNLTYQASLPIGPSTFRARAVNRAGESSDSNLVTVTRVREFPQLALNFTSTTLAEGSPIMGTVSLPIAEAADVVINVRSNRSGEVEAVPPLLITAGTISVDFPLVAIQDTRIEISGPVTITASAIAHRDAGSSLLLADDDTPALTLEIDETTVPEHFGSVTARVRRDIVSNRSITIDLSNTLPDQAQAPSQVTIPGSQAEVGFVINIVDDGDADGNQLPEFQARLRVANQVVSSSNVVALEVRDNEGPALTLIATRGLINEGSSANFTLRRSGVAPTAALAVTLTQIPNTEATVASQVTFPAGAAEIPVPISVPISPTSGTRTIILRAAATGYTDGLVRFSVTDVNKPDLTPDNLTAPLTAKTETSIPVDYRVRNLGSARASDIYLERVFLSTDPSPSNDDVLVRQVEQNGEVLAGGHYSRSVNIFTPRQIGTYYLIVTIDPSNSVAEVLETNNTFVRTIPLEVTAAYSATVQYAMEVVPTNTPLEFTGSATDPNSQPAAFSMINIHIGMGSTERVISAFTNSLGNFTTSWLPLPNEGGAYTIGAAHPGIGSAPVQDSFEILTLGFDAPPAVRLDEGETVITTATLRNPNARPLTGVAMTVVSSLPSGLSITPMVPSSTIPANDEIQVPITVSASTGFSGSGRFGLEVTTSEGIQMAQGINVRADLLKPVLSLDPSSLVCSVLRGGTKTVHFEVTNTGGLETGPITVLLPNLPWMGLTSTNPIPSLAPGDSTTVSLNLAPDSNVDLTLFSGNLALNAANGGSRNINYRFRVVSDLMGDLEVLVVDELYYFTEQAPPLEGATVVVRDAITSQQVATFTTGVDGMANFPDLTEGWYKLEVNAPQHDRYSNNIFIDAGTTKEELVFVSKQLVTYTWTVEEVEIEDIYRITVETVFETNVPTPVVRVTPSAINIEDLVALGQSKVVNLTLSNSGFIAAENGEMDFSTHPFYTFTPLITKVGTIPAKSSLVVPVTIKRVGIFDENGDIITLGKNGKPTAPRKAGSVPCGAGGQVTYSYDCGIFPVFKGAPIGVSGAQGNCGGGSGGGGYGGFHGGYFGSGGGGGPGGGGSSSGSSISFSSLDPCDECLARATLECIIGFIPGLGCGYGTAKCVSSTASSLGSGTAADQAVFGTAGSSQGDAVKNCLNAIASCAAEASKVTPLGWIISTIQCIDGFASCSGAGGGSGPGGPPVGEGRAPGGLKKAPRKAASSTNAELEALLGDPWLDVMGDELRTIAPGVASSLEDLETYLDVLAVLLGSRERVLLTAEDDGADWLQRYGIVTGTGSEDGQLISAAELASLDALAAPLGSDANQLSLAAARWNRSVQYGVMGIFREEDVPAGDNTDFIPTPLLLTAVDRMATVYDQNLEDGFLDPLEALARASESFQQEYAGEGGGTCARVKIQISQDLMITRTAFEADLQLENERDDVNVTNIGFDLQIRDLNGVPAEDLFNVQVTRLEELGAVDGTGELGAAETGSVQWTLIPRDTAALEEETKYTVGGVITFTQDGLDFTVPVENVPITVRPDASLSLKYFHQRDVFSDDPFTDAVEPSIPYRLAVLVQNDGFGSARDLKIISGQPKIIENDKGLFIDFKIIATQVDGQSVTPSLTAEFGELLPGESSIATWFLTSTLQGLFVDYDATFEHVTGLGDSRISLLQSVEIHEMIRMAQDKNGDPAFLVNDVVDVNDYPDTLYFQDGTTELVTVRESGTVTGSLGGGNLTVTLDTGAFSGWWYVRVPDPGDGNYRLVSVTDSNGRVLPLDENAWQSDRTFIGQGRRPVYENILHLLDCDSTGSYTLTYEVDPEADDTPPTSSVTALPANSPKDIPVFWSGTDDRGVAFYDIYVSANGSPWALWKDNTGEQGALYPGTVGETYAFYSIAIDYAGNNEAKAPVVEAMTEVVDNNQSPVISPIADQVINEGQTFRLKAVATDADGSSADLRFSLASAAKGLVINALTGEMRWVTGENAGGTVVSVAVIVTDAADPAGVANELFTITVVEQNSAPIVGVVPPQTLKAGGVLIVDVDATDPDDPAQTLTYSLGAGTPSGVAINPANGVVTWSPSAGQADTSHVITVLATDNGSPVLQGSTSFSVVVKPPDPDLPPAFTSIPLVLWLEGRSYSVEVAAVDPNGDLITLGANLAAVPGATFAHLGGGRGRVSWNTTGVAANVYQVPLTATAKGLTGTGTLFIRIVEDELYWSWMEETVGTQLPAGFTHADLDKSQDPDNDNRTNLHELIWLRHPLKKDDLSAAISFDDDQFTRTVKLQVRRRVGSETFVSMTPKWSRNMQDPWQIPANWTHAVDPLGDDDGDPDTELVDFFVNDEDSGGNLLLEKFFKVEAVENP